MGVIRMVDKEDTTLFTEEAVRRIPFSPEPDTKFTGEYEITIASTNQEDKLKGWTETYSQQDIHIFENNKTIVILKHNPSDDTYKTIYSEYKEVK